MERTKARASARQVRLRLVPAGSKLTSKSSSFTGFYNPRRKAGEVCHKDVWPVGR